MSIRVELADLPAQIERFGPRALLVTAGADGPPHVASVLVAVDTNGDLGMGAGRSARTNVAARPALTLVWTRDSEPDYGLVVDATALDAAAEPFLAQPISAVLHRLAVLPGGP